MPVKCPVMQSVQAKSVFRIQTILFILRPRNDMACREQRLNRQASHAAAKIVGGQNSVPKKFLIHTDANSRLPLNSSRRQIFRFQIGNFSIGFPSRSANNRSLSNARPSGCAANSRQTSTSPFAPCFMPRIPRACKAGSSRAKLESFKETEPTLRPRIRASSIMRGLFM